VLGTRVKAEQQGSPSRDQRQRYQRRISVACPYGRLFVVLVQRCLRVGPDSRSSVARRSSLAQEPRPIPRSRQAPSARSARSPSVALDLFIPVCSSRAGIRSRSTVSKRSPVGSSSRSRSPSGAVRPSLLHGFLFRSKSPDISDISCLSSLFVTPDKF